MNGPRNQLFARSGFPRNQNRCVGGRHRADRVEYPAQPSPFPDDATALFQCCCSKVEDATLSLRGHEFSYVLLISRRFIEQSPANIPGETRGGQPILPHGGNIIVVLRTV